MFGFAVTVGVHDDRVVDYLKNEKELMRYEDYDFKSDGEGFVHYTFIPTGKIGEEEFRHICNQLNSKDGVSLIGVDTQLTEKNIMKLADLIKEWSDPNTEEQPQLFPPGENGFIDLIDALEKTLNSWKDKYVKGFYTDEKNRADEYSLDLQELLELYKEKAPKKSSEGGMGDYNSKDGSHLNEQKVRKVIRKLIRQ